MRFSIIAVLASVVATVAAQTVGIAVHNPILGQVVNANTALTITWSNTDPTITNVNEISLMGGNSAALDIVIQNILPAPVPVADGQYTWNIPATVSTQPSYSLVLRDNNGIAHYSPYFTIMGSGHVAASVTSSSAASTGTNNPAATSGTKAATPSSGNSSTTAENDKSAASSIKAGLVGATVAGAIALFL
ncbi:hypothetical protein BDB01DRAFT_839951 [Pilobolus umbonatus]|nr:hypothetical protein BDB01DRAFT_839951 [Pilobolus umbonatus]